MMFLRCVACAFALAACDAQAPAPSSPAAVMLGRWQYAAPPMGGEGPSLNAGLQVTLAIDAVDNADFRGRVERWFSGDVGISPDVFGSIAGTMVTGQDVILTIPFARSGAPSLRIVGAVANDVLTVSECWMGEELGPFRVGAQFVRLDARAERTVGGAP